VFPVSRDTTAAGGSDDPGGPLRLRRLALRPAAGLPLDQPRDIHAGRHRGDRNPNGRYTITNNPVPGQQPSSTEYLPVPEGDGAATAAQTAALDIHVGESDERPNDSSSIAFVLYDYYGPGSYTVGGDGADINVDLVHSDLSSIGRWTSEDWRAVNTQPGKSWPGASCAVEIASDRATEHRGIRELKGDFSCRGLTRWAYQAQYADVRGGHLDVFIVVRWCTALRPNSISTTC
jgi:hypothetical protein